MEPFELLNIIKAEYQAVLNENLCGIYVHGSLAFGCFNPVKSDIDFIVVVNEPPTLDQKQALIQTLLQLNPEATKKGFEMSVVLLRDCLNFSHPTPFELHFSNAYLKRAIKNLPEYCRTVHGKDPDLAAHFTVIKHIGIVLCGKPIDEAFDEVPKAAYLDSIKADLENCESEIENSPVYYILNLCRTLAYFRDGIVVSKSDGGKWGISHLPDKYTALIQAALDSYSSDAEFESNRSVLREFAREMLLKII
ncbi:MAG TPA: DUF4111 domain-containing protein [Oscillospiraceae bacterium]|nr:DUF4111 domain-containing protein [Oscillospiraceae bacterium]HPF55726.1 DUF4111 domain-containing protein [Clostridiales bacterium]HPK36130.1 DUF4111 domain-containing protein [Oscillospiraceae bacterium]HPR76476.1 DUF4111 domain-containing protein [Oscillospiraceae bacterium]